MEQEQAGSSSQDPTTGGCSLSSRLHSPVDTHHQELLAAAPAVPANCSLQRGCGVAATQGQAMPDAGG